MSAVLLTSDVVLAVSGGKARLLMEGGDGPKTSQSMTIEEFERAVLLQLQTLVAMSDNPKATLERLTAAVVAAQEGDFPDAG